MCVLHCVFFSFPRWRGPLLAVSHYSPLIQLAVIDLPWLLLYVCVNMLKILQYTLSKSLHTWEMTKWFHFPASLCLYLKSSMPLLRFQITSWPSSSPTHPPRVIPSLVPHPWGVKTLSGAFPVRWELTGKAPDRHRCLLFPVISWRGKPLRRHYSSKDKYDRGMWWGDNQERKGERKKMEIMCKGGGGLMSWGKT